MPRDKNNTSLIVAYEDNEEIDTAFAEKDLLRAILISAMRDLEKGGELARKARRFFLTEGDDYLFNFNTICSLLELDPQKVLLVSGAYPEKLGHDKVKGKKDKKCLSRNLSPKDQGAKEWPKSEE